MPRRRRLSLRGLGAALPVLVLLACAAELQNPEAFRGRARPDGFGGEESVGPITPPAPATGGSAGGEAIPACVLALFDYGSKCGGGACHDNGPGSGGGLDLASPGVTARLLNQPAQHLDVEETASCPEGQLLINESAPDESWLLKKLTAGAFGDCGTRMPAAGALSPDEIQCLDGWIRSFR